MKLVLKGQLLNLPKEVKASFRSSRSSYDNYDDDFDTNYNDENDDVNNYYSRARSQRTPTTNTHWEDDVYDRGVDDLSDRFQRTGISSSSGNGAPSRPRSEKPDFGLGKTNPNNKGISSPPVSRRSPASSGAPKAVALYTFKGEQSGDLPFRKGDVVTILKKSDSQDDWWTGRVNGQEGIFPANYVELV